MRNARNPFRIAAFLSAVFVIAACAGGEDTAATDSAAAAAAAPPPPPESFSLVSKDGSWSGDIAPGGIVYRARGRDSLVFEFRPPTVNGALSEYESLLMASDTARITISLAMTSCSDNSGNQYSHMAQVWLTGKQGGRQLNSELQGCANKK